MPTSKFLLNEDQEVAIPSPKIKEKPQQSL